MTRASGSRAPSEGAILRARASLSAALLACGAVALAGCDIVQGFQNAGDALFPPATTYLDAPGYQVLSGDYTQAYFLSGEEVYVAARSASGGNALFLMHYATPEPCSLPRVGRFYGFRPHSSGGLVLSYFEDYEEPSTLHFADGSCKTFELTLDDAFLPRAAGDDGRILVESAGDLVAVDPTRNERTTIATEITRILQPTPFGSLDFLAGGQVGIVTQKDSTIVQWFGHRVREAVTTSRALLFEDEDGVHEIAASAFGDTTVVTDRSIDSTGCHLAALPAPDPPGAYFPAEWVAYNAGCRDTSVVIRDTRERTSMVLANHTLDARFLKAAPAGDPTEMPAPSLTDPMFVFYLDNMDPETGVGDLHVLDPYGYEQFIGRTSEFRRALLARRGLDGTPGYDHGYALLDVENGVGRLALWERGGSTRTVAEKVANVDLAAPWPVFLSDFEAGTGRLVQLAKGELHELATGVPDSGGSLPNFSEYESGNALLFSDFDGSTGTLSFAAVLEGAHAGSDDFGEPLRTAALIARRVGWYKRSFLGSFPGFIYITDFDPARGTGRLEYRNTELGFTSTVNDGAASLYDTGTSVLYTVPYGERAGIWITRKK